MSRLEAMKFRPQILNVPDQKARVGYVEPTAPQGGTFEGWEHKLTAAENLKGADVNLGKFQTKEAVASATKGAPTAQDAVLEDVLG